MSKQPGRKARGLSQDEHDLWDVVTRSIAPLKVRKSRVQARDEGEASPETETAAPAKVKRTAPAPPPPPAAAKAAAQSPPAPGPLERRLKSRIARGTQAIDARIDLHGMTQAQAHAALLRFLRRAQDDGALLALVITGKGARGRSGDAAGVLRRQVPLWLKLSEFSAFVVGFSPAAAAHGGEGALYVRLRRARA